MKLHRNAPIFILLIIAMALTSCQSKIPGINEPITHQEREVVITSAEFLDVYTDSTNRELYPASTDDQFLVVKADISPTDEIEHDDWVATIVDDLGNSQEPSIRGSRRVIEGDSLTAEWVFVVSKNAESFTLKLGENEVELVDSIWIQPEE